MKRISQGGEPSHGPSATLPQSLASLMTPSFFDDSAPSQAAVSAPLRWRVWSGTEILGRRLDPRCVAGGQHWL